MAGWNAAMASGIVRSDPPLPPASCIIPPHEDTPLANGKRGMSSDHRKIHSLARKTAKLCNENVSISSIFFYLIHFLSKVIAISQFSLV